MFEKLVVLVWGTGFGGGIYENGHVREGVYDGELGHSVAPSFLTRTLRRRCGCGQQNHVEALGGTEGLSILGRRAANVRGSLLVERGWNDLRGFEKKTRLILDCASEGDQASQEIVKFGGECVGAACAASINFVDPDSFVIGGGFLNAPEATRKLFMSGVLSGMKLSTWGPVADKLGKTGGKKIRRAKLGSYAGCLGVLPKLIERYQDSV